MGWVKRALIGSAVWFIFLITMLLGAFFYVNSHPPIGLSDEQVSEKFGEAFAIGIFLILVIWAYEYTRSRKKTK